MKFFSKSALAVAVGAATLCGGAIAQNASTVIRGAVVTHTPAAAESAAAPDFVNARPMRMPAVAAKSTTYAQDLSLAINTPALAGRAGSVPGDDGDGRQIVPATFLGFNANISGDAVAPAEFGSSAHPFSTARADLNSPTNRAFPYRASGKLFFNIGSSSFVCSASLIKPGVVVTAAHCVADFGASTFYTNVRFVPGYRDGVAPWGVWSAASITVMTSYYNGTDSCAVSGIVCRNDVATIRLALPAGVTRYVGKATGFYGYGWDGYGFNSASPNFTHITQTGYPVCLDNGQKMQRNDSHGFRDASLVDNTVIGSLMCGGSSGGPWLVNFGVRPTLTGTTNGTAAEPNTVVGVTSWGYVSTAVKQQGASRFTSTNIVPLVNTYCPAGSTQPFCK